MRNRLRSPATGQPLDSEVCLLETSGHRSRALHEQVHAHLQGTDGSGLWIDARRNALTALLLQPGARPRLRIARAFTAYQHYELVRTTPRALPPDAELVVLPCITALYADPDVPTEEGSVYLESALAILEEVANMADLAVLVSSRPVNPLHSTVRRAAAETVSADAAGLAQRWTGGSERVGHWIDGTRQTTIPYWTDRLATVDGRPALDGTDVAGTMPAVL